ncbi:MAG: poly-gamma-glutamate biosynthesis protein PgsC [Clostridiales bacterium]|jgi:poly-gamma-glutamate biosynthesis protein PgsC/CapC|nr:poly-gamma-glutamate biosynthesis protein PgsC [Clostridiales bacterium]
MYLSDLYIALLIGLTVSLLASEFFGVLPGGIIVPGYLALVCDTPSVVLLAILISIITYFLVKYPLAKVMILYGRRRFVAILIIAILIKLGLEFFFPVLPFAEFEFRGIGIVVPALIANCYFRQGVKLTLTATTVTTLVTFGFVSVFYYLF